jgi:hypothetical protein
MKTKIIAIFLLAALAGAATGCVETVDGRSQAGVPFGKDRIEGRYERSPAQVLAAARAVLKFKGTLTGDNTVNNSLVGRVNQTTVYVKVDEIDSAKPVTRVVVQARTGAGTDIDLAADIEKNIGIYLTAH